MSTKLLKENIKRTVCPCLSALYCILDNHGKFTSVSFSSIEGSRKSLTFGLYCCLKAWMLKNVLKNSIGTVLYITPGAFFSIAAFWQDRPQPGIWNITFKPHWTGCLGLDWKWLLGTGFRFGLFHLPFCKKFALEFLLRPEFLPLPWCLNCLWRLT